ncbi:MAG: glycosyltransferase [Candidatus Thorarchaeota archaeon]
MRRVVLVGSEPERMTRLRRTYSSLRSLGIDVSVLNPYSVPRGRPRLLTALVRYLLIMVQLVLLRADVYHLYNVPDLIGLPLLLKRGMLVYDVRSPWFSTVRESLGGDILWRFAETVEWMLTRRADYVVTANTPLAMRARRWGARRVMVVPNYPPTSFRSRRTREEMRVQLGLGAGPVIAFVGKISRLEGSELLKRIIGEVCRSHPEVVFLIVGDGPARASLEQFIRSRGLTQRVRFVGWVAHSEVPDYIVAADLCLLPRLWTSFSPYTTPENILKVNEYLALSRPVVAPKMGGFSDASFPVIAVPPERMGQAVLDYLRDPRPFPDTERPTWQVSESRLAQVYRELGVLA